MVRLEEAVAAAIAITSTTVPRPLRPVEVVVMVVLGEAITVVVAEDEAVDDTTTTAMIGSSAGDEVEGLPLLSGIATIIIVSVITQRMPYTRNDSNHRLVQ